jgi:hypothetical protein
MPIPNFSDLLNQALKGDSKALAEWTKYTERESFSEQEISLALATIDGSLSSENVLQKSYALYLRALWHEHGIGGDTNNLEAIRLYDNFAKIALDSLREQLEKEAGKEAPEAPLTEKQQDKEKEQPQQEEQLQKAEQEEQKRSIEITKEKLEKALKTLEEKIGKTDQHHSQKACDVATKLLTDLTIAKDQYITDRLNPAIKILDANTSFVQKCKTLINEAKPILEKDLDLGWGDYLIELLQTIVNAITWTVTFGQFCLFPPPERTKSVQAVEEAQSLMAVYPHQSKK